LILEVSMGNRDSGTHQAVFFLDNKQVTRQMLFSEFEALLDGLGGLPDYADEEAHAVYATIGKSGKITSLVFFILYFDESGRADSSWNVPIERLSEVSGRGPDLGGGTIRLACRGQCSINWHQNDLWDPDMTPGSNDFLLLKKAVDENRLHFNFEVEDVPVLSSSSTLLNDIPDDADTDKRIKLARLLKEQRLRIRMLESNQELVADTSSHEQKIIIHAYKNELQEQKRTIEQLKLMNEKLKEKLSSRNDQFIHLQDKVSDQTELVRNLETKLKGASGSDRESLEKQKMAAEIVLLSEQLDRKELDLAYRDEREELLRSELEELSSTIGEGESESKILDKLKSLEVVYVAYHPGVGHITMTSLEIREYADNPTAFVAKKCFVTESHYLAWLEHYENPICCFESESGKVCGQNVEKISVPSEFEQGVNDYCEQHTAS